MKRHAVDDIRGDVSALHSPDRNSASAAASYKVPRVAALACASRLKAIAETEAVQFDNVITSEDDLLSTESIGSAGELTEDVAVEEVFRTVRRRGWYGDRVHRLSRGCRGRCSRLSF